MDYTVKLEILMLHEFWLFSCTFELVLNLKCTKVYILYVDYSGWLKNKNKNETEKQTKMSKITEAQKITCTKFTSFTFLQSAYRNKWASSICINVCVRVWKWTQYKQGNDDNMLCAQMRMSCWVSILGGGYSVQKTLRGRAANIGSKIILLVYEWPLIKCRIL